MHHTHDFILRALVMFAALSSGIANAKGIDGNQLLSPEHLPEIRIEIASDDWDKLRVQTRDPSAIFGGVDTNRDPYSYFKADIWIDGTKIDSVGIRKKGFFGSADSDRPSLKIKFDEFVNQDPVKGLSRLTLNNNKQDRSQLNQFITYKIFRDAGVHAPRSNLARVTVNGTYLGIYSNVESIKKAFLQNRFGDKTGNLYEGQLTDFHPKTLDKIEVKTNEESNDLHDIGRLVDLLATDGELDLDELGQVIHLDYFMRYWAIEGMIRFWDGYTSNQNNFYLYINPVDGLGYFIPWGADAALTDGGPFARFSQEGNTAIYAQSILANRLYKSDGVPERYRKTLLALLDQVWNQNELIAEVDRLEKLISDHLHESQQDTPQAIESLKRFIKSRPAELRRALEQWPATVPAEPRKPMYTVAVGHAKGTFTAQWADTPPRDGADSGQVDMQLNLDGQSVDFERIGVTVFRLQFPGFGGPGGPGFGGAPGGGGGPGFGGPPADFKPPLSLTFTGVRRSDGERITLGLFVDQDAFLSKREDGISVSGSLNIGQGGGFGFGFGPRQSLAGTLKLTESGIKVGDKITGAFDLQIVETHGGIFNAMQPPPGAPGGPRRLGPNLTPGRRPGAAPFPIGGRRQPPQRSIGLIELLDEDDNGKLSSNEIESAVSTIRQLDRNQDGEVTANELMVPPRSGSETSGQPPRNRFDAQQ